MVFIRFVHLVALLVVLMAQTGISVQVTVSPSCSRGSSSCVTLFDLEISATATNVSLVFLPGTHYSLTSLQVRNKFSFEMKSESTQATIRCGINTNFQINRASSAIVTNLNFVGCRLNVINSNNSIIANSRFSDVNGYAVQFTSCFDVIIDNSTFMYSTQGLYFSNTRGIEVTRSNFINNGPTYSSVMIIYKSFGFLGCCNFRNNSINNYNGGMIAVSAGSIFYFVNSTFTNNALYSIIYIASNSRATVFSSVFKYNVVHRGIFYPNTGDFISVVDTEFSHNTGRLIYSNYNYKPVVALDCNIYLNSSVRNHFVSANSSLCGKLHNTLVDSEACENSTCEEECKPPPIKISLERSSYKVQEDISSSSKALQVCAVVTDAQYAISANIEIKNGSAKENTDFRILKPDCREVEFVRQAGTQSQCTYVTIIQDSEVEGNEEFFVSVTSPSPYVAFDTEATVTIIEEDSSLPPGNGPTKSAMVECGILRRPIRYFSGENDVTNLKKSIAHSFGELTGIKTSHIALLQIKSQKSDDYLDMLSATTTIEEKSLVKVILYIEYKDSCMARST